METGQRVQLQRQGSVVGTHRPGRDPAAGASFWSVTVMATIRVTSFQPFTSRVGVDTVLSVRFPFALKERFKAKAKEAAVRSGIKNGYGWLSEHNTWFVERSVWPE